MNSMAVGTRWLVAMAAPVDGASAWPQLATMLVIFGIFFFIVLLPMKRKQKKVDEFLEHLKVGDRIMTTGGIYGAITRLGDRSVQIQIADKVRIEVAKASIGGYQGQEPIVTEPQGQ